MFYKNKTVAVVGGKNAAVMSAVMLSDIADKVFVIYRGIEFAGEPAWVDQLNSRKNIEAVFQTLPTGFEGENKLKELNFLSHTMENHI
jgi:thioredoxin reductase (NADPH)